MRQVGQGLRSPACRASESGLNGADSACSVASTTTARSPSGRVQPACLADRKLPPASRRSRLRSQPLPTLPRRRLGGWMKTFAGFERGFGIDGPSRPRRCPRPARWQGAGLDANDGPRRRRSFSCPTSAAPSAPRAWTGATRRGGKTQAGYRSAESRRRWLSGTADDPSATYRPSNSSPKSSRSSGRLTQLLLP